MEKKLRYRRLDRYNQAKIIDTNVGSPNYFRITSVPSVLCGGKNLIRLQSNSNTMYKDTKVDFEILDFNGEPIYYEILDVLEFDKSRIISVHIYQSTPVGQALLTFLGYAKKDRDGNELEYTDGVPNIKHQMKIHVDPKRKNTSDISFSKAPESLVTEKLVTFIEKENNNSTTGSSGTINYLSTNERALVGSNGFEFNQDMSGSDLIVTSPTNAIPESSFTPSSSIYRTKIKKVLRNNLVEVEDKYGIKNDLGNKIHYYNKFDNSSYEIRYSLSGSNKETSNKKSYAQITLGRLQPTTGDIKKIRTYVRGNGQTTSDFNLVNEQDVRNTNLLIDYTTNDLENELGVFTSQSVYDNYYQASSGSGLEPLTASLDSSKIFNSIKFEYPNSLSSDEYYYVSLKSDYYLTFYETSNYVAEFDLYCEKNSDSNPKLDLFIDGNPFKDLTSSNGKLLKTFESNQKVKNFGRLSIPFVADKDGIGTFRLRIKDGFWWLSNLEIKAEQERGFTPNHTVMNIPIPTEQRNNKLDFRFEFLDYRGVPAQTGIQKSNVSFVGENTYISGNDNVLNGNMFISSNTTNGINVIGGETYGALRSEGYIGLEESLDSGSSGFHVFESTSSSYFTTANDSNDYNMTAGLDLVADSGDYLKFRTTGTSSGIELVSKNILNVVYNRTGTTQTSSDSATLVDEFVVNKSEIDTHIAVLGRWYVESGGSELDKGEYTLLIATPDGSSSYIENPATEVWEYGDGITTGSNFQSSTVATFSIVSSETASLLKVKSYHNKSTGGDFNYDSVVGDFVYILCNERQAQYLQEIYPRNPDI